MALVASVQGVFVHSIERWNRLIKSHGNVLPECERTKSSRWPPIAIAFVEDYIKHYPCFYLEELQEAVKERFNGTLHASTPRIYRLLRFDLNITRKVLTKRPRKSVPVELVGFYRKLRPLYSGPDQLVFIDETSKDGRGALRDDVWFRKNTSAIDSLPFTEGERRSVLTAFDVSVLFAWESTPGTFDRLVFHEVFKTRIAPYINPWPQPRSIIILDNAKIHIYCEFEELVHSRGGIRCFCRRTPPTKPN
ncbi:Transposase [Phytophthora megakarya]|uniref:Transposase n=1 Tax=Phytophthora megakarya TaxID=4795 RepID=A0A225WG27_9STRA|nr:Transposase [Phytophthora megakarya]